MVNEIKLDNGNPIPATPLQPGSANKSQSIVSTKENDVTVTNHLGQLVTLLGKDDALDESSRVAATRRLIESGQYQVKVNELSEKLLNSGLLTGVR